MPRPVQCGGFQKLIQTAVLWFSSGGTKSVLHNDSVDNINCLLDGQKSIVMIDKVCRVTRWKINEIDIPSKVFITMCPCLVINL